VKGNPQALLTLTGKVESGGSPGGSLPVRNGFLPQAEQVTWLPKRVRKGRNVAVTMGTGGRE